MQQELTLETIHQHPETVWSSEQVAHLGRIAIQSERLGINDPLTHLNQYLEKGEPALVGIKEDLETDSFCKLRRL
jgi:hypothetical protein